MTNYGTEVSPSELKFLDMVKAHFLLLCYLAVSELL